jgi:hypothetical protein
MGLVVSFSYFPPLNFTMKMRVHELCIGSWWSAFYYLYDLSRVSSCSVPVTVLLIIPVIFLKFYHPLVLCYQNVTMFQALSSYQKALQVLSTRKNNPAIWDTVIWELSTTLFTMGTLLQDFPAYSIKVIMADCKRQRKKIQDWSN